MAQVRFLIRDHANDAGTFEVRDDDDGTLVGIIDIGREHITGPRPGRGWYVRDDQEGIRLCGWFELGEGAADLTTAVHLWNEAPLLGQLLDEEALDGL